VAFGAATVARNRPLHYAPPMRRALPFLAMSFLICGFAHAAPQRPSADQLLAAAKSEAVAQHKPVFLVFGASWCPPCRQMDAFMGDSKIRPILEKYFVVAHPEC
jgi:thiol-disulfide isomerase/thioredoxin